MAVSSASIRVVRQRLRQGIAALRASRTPDADGLAQTWLAPGELGLFQAMPPHDQAHAVRVARWLLDSGHDDRDLVAAALLHDVAKAGTPACPGRVRLPDRVLRVILGWIAPPAWRWLTADPDRPLGRGLYLAAHHARLGAVAATDAGSSDRTSWLIAHHECRDLPDDDLQQLIAADKASV